jgi:hypothetical protein
VNLKEKKPRKRWKKILLALSVTIVAFVTIVILFISPIAKYLIEKYDVKYTGREIKMNWIYVNPFTGGVYIKNLEIDEQNSDTIFFSASTVNADISMSKLFNRTFEISSITLTQPKGTVTQNIKHFNFSDLVEKFSSKGEKKQNKTPFHFNILNIEINDAEVFYAEQVIPINYFIKKFNFKSEGKYWNSDTLKGEFHFLAGPGSGDVTGDFMLNVHTLDYRLKTVIKKFDLSVFEQYLKDLSNYGNFSAFADANLRATGNLNDKKQINLKGDLAISDFHFGEKPGDDYASFKKFSIGIDELDPKNKKFFFDTASLVSPFFKYEKYDNSLDNFQRMFGKKGARVGGKNPEKFNLIIKIADYVKVVFKNFLKSDYIINKLDISKGNLLFDDYSVSEKFSMALDNIHVRGDSIDNNKRWVKLFMDSDIKPYGSVKLEVSMNPKNNKDFDMKYNIQKVPATMFNPYLITYTSFPLDRGTIELNGNWKVRNDIIYSNNHFLSIDPRISKRIRRKDTRWLPIPLIMSVVRERGNVIDYQIPITGNLSSPDFHWKGVIVDAVENILIKPPTTPYSIEVRNTETEVEKSLSLKWGMNQPALLETKDKFMDRMADFLEENPTARITIQPFEYVEKEKEYIVFYEAKKKYFMRNTDSKKGKVTEDDSVSIVQMSNKDAGFVKFLTEFASDSMLFTVQEKCYRYVGVDFVNEKYENLVKERKKEFLSFFKENKTEKQIYFLASENTVPFNGFSYYKINYKGDIPESLVQAYERLKEINNESPRKKYLRFRKNKK